MTERYPLQSTASAHCSSTRGLEMQGWHNPDFKVVVHRLLQLKCVLLSWGKSAWMLQSLDKGKGDGCRH